MERIGIYGGTFNPPHLGHFRAAAYAAQALNLDRLLMIPDRIAPHKEIPEGSPTPWQRLEMVRLGAEGCIEACDLELNREGPSYTYQTILQLQEQYPAAKLYLLMGTDMFLSFSTWRNPEVILAHAALGVFYRGDADEVAKIHAVKAQMEESGAEIHLVENPVTAISSTQLRRMLVFRCAEEFLPEPVARYIYDSGFYGTGRDYRNLSIEELQETVVKLLKPNRVAHVLGCAQTAGELARIYGVDETDAIRAALLHDITKALDGPLQLTLCNRYGKILSDFSRKYPKTLHALTGSLVAERIFGENEAVVSAICHHTTGKAGMNLLEKIIYVADYMEPCRNFPGVEKLRELAFADMDAALRLGLEMTLQHLANLGDEVSPESREALDYLKNCSE